VNPRPATVSVIDPISPAIERVRTVLFRPFDLGKWFVIGFSAWLARLGSGGGSGNSGGNDDGGGRAIRPDNIVDEARRTYEQAHDYVTANLDWIVPVAVLVGVVVITVWLLVVWLSSRGRFTFLYCVAQNKGEFWNPWRQYQGSGSSLFAFRIVLGLLGFLTVMTFLILSGVLTFFSIRTLGFNLLTISGIIMSGMLFIASLILFGLVGLFTTDFVVPIMYQNNLKCTDAWRVLLEMIAGNMARFFVYLLFRFVMAVAIFLMVVIAGCVCCCACCLMMIPYIGTVLLLPVFVFVRSYSLYYLAQYGPEFYVFEPGPEAVPSAGELQV